MSSKDHLLDGIAEKMALVTHHPNIRVLWVIAEFEGVPLTV